MTIKKITFSLRRDFSAIMECEHCQHTQKITSGYDDAYYHERVIPVMTCQKCGKNRAGVVPEQRNDSGTGPVPSKEVA